MSELLMVYLTGHKAKNKIKATSTEYKSLDCKFEKVLTYKFVAISSVYLQTSKILILRN